MLLHFDVGREASIKALDEAMSSGQTVYLVTQRDLSVESPQQEDLYTIGTISAVRQILRLPAGRCG
jgi:ATP-dependent Lon protease